MIAVPSPGTRRPPLEPGQVVRHLRYHYRGVVVARDAECRASDEWYNKNRTQPPRDQYWYHVLVDGSTTCTYVAGQHLVAETTGEPVQHPLLWYYFSDFADGCYIRNDTVWPDA